MSRLVPHECPPRRRTRVVFSRRTAAQFNIEVPALVPIIFSPSVVTVMFSTTAAAQDGALRFVSAQDLGGGPVRHVRPAQFSTVRGAPVDYSLSNAAVPGKA